jgi:hypothetical protein
MNTKIARFVPLAIGALFLIRELLILVSTYSFNVLRYVFPRGIYFDQHLILSFIIFLLKILFLVGFLYAFKMYSDGNLSKVKVAAGVLLGLHVFRSIVTTISQPWEDSAFIGLLVLPIFLLLIANLVLALTAKNPSAPPQPNQ